MRRVNLIAWDNGFGLTKNLRLLKEALTAGGHRVEVSAIRRGKLRKIFNPLKTRARVASRRWTGRDARLHDVNLMLEHVRPEYAPLARRNVLMPHPEWFDAKDGAALGSIDHVFTLTEH